ncbi:hypothetical protein [Streptomyces sp. 7N604]|uniref:hypothetical protein n=1 Tax=Streptomyces sp. 7N604 TaxID=3457415 RepID=UPI003FD3745C
MGEVVPGEWRICTAPTLPADFAAQWRGRGPSTNIVVDDLPDRDTARVLAGRGVEPLLLPITDSCTNDADDSAGRGEGCPGAVSVIQRLATEALGAPSGSREQLSWFRWITGHQVGFILWQLIAELLADPEHTEPNTQETMADYVNAYSGMLLYAGSCPRDVYHRLIRPGMRAWHEAFSGSWAPDYKLVRKLMRNRHGSRLDAPLRDAVELQQEVHDHVARRLVPDGTSLLQAAHYQTTEQRPLLYMLYDSFFSTLRAPVQRSQVLAQLMRRLAKIILDVRANPLPRPDMAGLSPEVGAPISALGAGLVGVCVRAAVAAGSPASGLAVVAEESRVKAVGPAGRG